jgi:hypothetical protein
MSPKAIRSILLSTSLLVSSSIFADSTFIPRAEIGYASYKFDILIANGDGYGGDFKLDSTYLKGTVGGTVLNGRTYVDLAYSTSGPADGDFEGGTTDFDRSDLTLTAGYVLPNNVAIFGGYKKGTSTYKNWSDDAANTESTQFSASGIYVGAGYNMPHGNNVFSINGAIAILDGSYVESGYADIPDFELTTDSTGVSVGVGYNIPLSEGTGILLKANYQRYEYKNFKGIDELGDDFLDNVTMAESIIALEVGYNARFN